VHCHCGAHRHFTIVLAVGAEGWFSRAAVAFGWVRFILSAPTRLPCSSLTAIDVIKNLFALWPFV
jgi:hypothetical protein